MIRGGGEGTSRKVIERDAELRRSKAAWEITAKDVPIEQGTNEVEVWAENADGPCPEPGRRKGIIYKGPLPPKPEIRLLQPADNLSVFKSVCWVKFRVRSASPLKRVELVRQGVDRPRTDPLGRRRPARPPGRSGRVRGRRGRGRAAGAAGQPSGSAGGQRGWRGFGPAGRELRLAPGERRHRPARAEGRRPGVDCAGRVPGQSDRVRAVRADRPGLVARPGDLAGRGDQEGQGKGEDPAAGLDQRRPARQRRARGLQADHELEQEFQAGLLLDREENRIEIEAPPGLARDAGDRPELRIGCRSPDPMQRLHLLLVGVGQSSEKALRERALTALQGELVPGERRKIRTPAFAQGRLYRPLIGDVRKTEFLGQVDNIQFQDEFDPRLNPDRPREVVLIYYEGAEWMSEGKLSLRLKPGANPPMT